MLKLQGQKCGLFTRYEKKTRLKPNYERLNETQHSCGVRIFRKV